MDFNEETGIDLPGLRPRLGARSVRELVVGSRAGPVTQEADPCLCQGAFGAPCVSAFNEAVKDESKIHSVVQTASG